LVVQSLLAGVDHFLVREPRARQEAAFAALVRAAETRTEVRARVQESAARVAGFKALLSPRMPADQAELLARLGTPEHQALAASFPRVNATAAVGSPVADS
jgi:beta-glucosidase-like glycosyl hydrolase